ncbi:PduL/EutD family phosphate acyltransferase [Oscillibacter sp. GMB15532]|uniref:PduL/EutD family phosphate acyltransferase n=1 Tax=Oscillibacter sp. GMB15532 TaxID=3230022 RepID=UPI0034DDFF93
MENKLNSIEVMLDNHHVHLRQETVEKLFGEGYVLPQKKYLGGGEYISTETIDVTGPKGTISGIRVMGPNRPFDQAELLQSDALKLGVNAPIVESGHLENACELTLVGPKASVTLKCGIVAARHVHICTKDLARIGVRNMQTVSITSGGIRSVTFHNVIVRENTVSDVNVIHMDFEEGNAAGVKNGDILELEF